MSLLGLQNKVVKLSFYAADLFFLIEHTIELQQLDDDIQMHVAVETVINCAYTGSQTEDEE